MAPGGRRVAFADAGELGTIPRTPYMSALRLERRVEHWLVGRASLQRLHANRMGRFMFIVSVYRILLLILPDARYTFHVASTTLHEPFFSSRLLSDLKSRRSYIFSLLSTYLTSKRDLSFGHSSHRTARSPPRTVPRESGRRRAGGTGHGAGHRDASRRRCPLGIARPLALIRSVIARHDTQHRISHTVSYHIAARTDYLYMYGIVYRRELTYTQL